MLLAEILALIALEPTTGAPRKKLERLHRQDVLAVALLMELAVQTRIGLRKQVVVVLDTLPSRHPLLTACLRRVIKESGKLRTDALIQLVSRNLDRLSDEMLEALVRRDILHPPKRRFGFFGAKFFAVRSNQAQGECLRQFQDAASGVDTSLQGLALLSLGVATGAIDQLLTFEEAESAKARLRDLRQEITEALAALHSDAEPGSIRVGASQPVEQTHGAAPIGLESDEIYSIALLEALELSLELKLRN